MKLWLWRDGCHYKVSNEKPSFTPRSLLFEGLDLCPDAARTFSKLTGVRWPRVGAAPVCYEIERPAKLRRVGGRGR